MVWRHWREDLGQNGYTAQTPHYFWDGRVHYWTGMAVNGTEDQDPDNPNCCHDPAVFEKVDFNLGREGLRTLRHGLRGRGHTHRSAADRLGLGLSGVRDRLYGKRPFRRGDFNVLCRLAGVDPDGLARVGREEG